VTLFVLGGADPVAVLFARISAVGTLGIIALMGIASAAVYMFFRTHPGNVWRVRLFPLASTLGLAMVLVLGCANFGALAGGSSPMVLWLPVTLLAAAAGGWVMADRLRRRDLAGFRELGSVSL
jgi:hypothetical protein